MNEYIMNVTLIGENQDLCAVVNALYDHYSPEQTEEYLKSKRGERDQNHEPGSSYEERMILRYSDENGYYQMKAECWEDKIGETGDAYVRIINNNRLEMKLYSRDCINIESFCDISRTYPYVVFYSHLYRWHMAIDHYNVVMGGKIRNSMRESIEYNSEEDSYETTIQFRTGHESTSRIRPRIQRLNEKGKWEMYGIRIVDECPDYVGSAYDTNEDDSMLGK